MMEICADFLELLGPDTSTSVLMLLDDPADLVRVSAVSRSWRRFVITNSFCKKLCLRLYPEVSCFAYVTEGISRKDIIDIGSSAAMERESLEREHRAYSYLSHCLVSPMENRECIAWTICASSTDNYPDEGIENTLIESERVHMQPSYWSSQGASDPEVPETLTYRLHTMLCIVNEINIQPFEAYFQPGSPMYSAEAVRFRFGHSMSLQNFGEQNTYSTGENFQWAYVSPEFPMLQQNELQSFKLPQPVICIGGIVQIELLGRVQIQEIDDLYYLCACHVQIIGCPLSPAFETGVDETFKTLVLKYFPEKQNTCISLDDTVTMAPAGVLIV